MGNDPIVFVHGNSDMARGTVEPQMGWTKPKNYFTSHGYKLSELYGFTWGPVQTADVTMPGERAASVPIQVIGVSGFSAVPDSCSSTGCPSENGLSPLDANGILGIGLFRPACRPACAVGGAPNPGPD